MIFEIPPDLHAKREAYRKRERERKREAKRMKILMGETPDQPAIRIRPRWVDLMPQVTKAQFERYCKAKDFKAK